MIGCASVATTLAGSLAKHLARQKLNAGQFVVQSCGPA
ncbi:hypothetical protein FG93_05193 [Bosea sp. LC85]|nr:hypothetical protein FG93_05193 [Bosea sp. LC85]